MEKGKGILCIKCFTSSMNVSYLQKFLMPEEAHTFPVFYRNGHIYFFFKNLQLDQAVLKAFDISHRAAKNNLERPKKPIRFSLSLSSDEDDMVVDKGLELINSPASIREEKFLWENRRETAPIFITPDFYEQLPATTKAQYIMEEVVLPEAETAMTGPLVYKLLQKPSEQSNTNGEQEKETTEYVTPDSPLVLTQLELNQFRGAKKLTIPLHDRLNVFVGINGSGKTTVLEAVSILFSWFIRRIKSPSASGRLFSEYDGRFNSGEVSLSAQAKLGNTSFKWTYSKNSKRTDLDELNAITRKIASAYQYAETNMPLFVYYPVHRVIKDIPLRIRDKQKLDNLIAYEENQVQINFRTFFKWFRDREDLENDNRRYLNSPDKPIGYQFPDPQLQAVRKALGGMLEGFEDLEVRRKPKLRMVLKKNGTLFAFNQLSDGEKCLIALVCDLARRLAMLNPLRENPLDGFGIVAIDEIDLHLHPTWQYRVIPLLSKVFPNCQFLISTHSTSVITHVEDASLFALKQNGDELVLDDDLTATYGKNADRILLDLMGLPSTRPQEIQDQLDQLFDLISQSKTPEEFRIAQEKLSKIRSQIGQDPELTEAEISIHLRRDAYEHNGASIEVYSEKE